MSVVSKKIFCFLRQYVGAVAALSYYRFQQ